MSGLVEFLRARYSEAREQANRKRRSIPSPFDGHEVEITYSSDEGEVVLVDGHPYPADKYWAIASEPAPDPDALADLAAKQAVVDHVARELDSSDAPWWYADRLTPILAALALPFADHPDYDERWKP